MTSVVVNASHDGAGQRLRVRCYTCEARRASRFGWPTRGHRRVCLGSIGRAPDAAAIATKPAVARSSRPRWQELARASLGSHSKTTAAGLCVANQTVPASDLSEGEVTAIKVEKCGREELPCRTYDHPSGVQVAVFREGDGNTFASSSVDAHLIGRLLPSGFVFESTRGKGRPAMELKMGQNAIVPGMELGLKTLSLGAKADIRIPAALAYAHMGVPKLVPPNTDISFEVEVVSMDGKRHQLDEGSGGASRITAGSEAIVGRECDVGVPSPLVVRSIRHPWWLARVELPNPSSYYLSFCRWWNSSPCLDWQSRHLSDALSENMLLKGAKAIPRKRHFSDALGWNLSRDGALVVGGAQDAWRARVEWDFNWFKHNLGDCRQLVKWQGPIFTTKESLVDCPVLEASVSEYVDYVQSLDLADRDCAEINAGACPRLYLNGWPVFNQLPWLRDYIGRPDFPKDLTEQFIAEQDELQEAFLKAFTREGTPLADRKKATVEANWEMTKLFLSPKGAVTRLHFDNGGAHAWLTQVRGRKLFVCFAPADGQHLHPFVGDEGLLNGSWIDPLDADVNTKWENYSKATPHIAIVEEGETIIAPQGWWHYAVSLDASITVMRNFYDSSNCHEFRNRKDERLETALLDTVLSQDSFKKMTKDQKKEAARRMIDEIRCELSKHAKLKVESGRHSG